MHLTFSPYFPPINSHSHYKTRTVCFKLQEHRQQFLSRRKVKKVKFKMHGQRLNQHYSTLTSTAVTSEIQPAVSSV